MESIFWWLIWQWWLERFAGDQVLAVAVGVLVLAVAGAVVWGLLELAFDHPGGCLAVVVVLAVAVIVWRLVPWERIPRVVWWLVIAAVGTSISHYLEKRKPEEKPEAEEEPETEG